jgi:carbon storage regulator
MLVLRRKAGERIVINDSIEVTVLRVHGGKVRLGFTAPPSVHVLRQEAKRAGPAPREALPRDETLHRQEPTFSRDDVGGINIGVARGSETPEVAVGSSHGEKEGPTEVDCSCGPSLDENSQEEISRASTAAPCIGGGSGIGAGL